MNPLWIYSRPPYYKRMFTPVEFNPHEEGSAGAFRLLPCTKNSQLKQRVISFVENES